MTHAEAQVQRKAFIVEDAADIQAVLRLLLVSEGFEVLATAATELQAYEWLQQNEASWDVVTIDLLLAEGSGVDVLRRFATSRDAGQVVVFSAFVTSTVRERCLALGANAVFSKTESAQLAQYLRGVPQRREPGAPRP